MDRTRWEYQILIVLFNENTREIVPTPQTLNRLEELGEEGWEASIMIGQYSLLLKRKFMYHFPLEEANG